ncbi:Dihydropteroate synthase-like protein [Lineolata rhizophorae]|uniref:2-amino-4-hydroxy-6-hydroxymethyldihydropteridine diphosphokinase n=1 Tax=Lineolata rhizophorae TaxID=578093 RepID=A0A6A6NZE1_9PEZI|nr:Dihydropteroate synthase-like protein [Lineolata rhizophorae]
MASQPAATNGATFAHTAYVALGSNMGDRIMHIERACAEMERQGDIRITRSSFLYETAAMYVVEQAKFVNACIEISTSLSPIALLDRLQSIEDALGRVRVIDKGPRTIDLDILLYDDTTLSTPRLTIPHALMLEREFVLRPLCDMIATHTPPTTPNVPLSTHLSSLPPSPHPFTILTPISPYLPPLRPLDPARRTLIMSILNLTPDSFSDGGRLSPAPDSPDGGDARAMEMFKARLKDEMERHLSEGADILDIGAQSTRPGAEDIGASREIARLAPAWEVLRSLYPPSTQPRASSPHDQAGTPRHRATISLDTYRPAVLTASFATSPPLPHGPHILNDISGGTLSPALFPTLGAHSRALLLSRTPSPPPSLVISHLRGTPASMGAAPHAVYAGGPRGALRAVARELRARVRAAERAGVRRWRILLDPGVGFAKGERVNLAVLRHLGALRGEVGWGQVPGEEEEEEEEGVEGREDGQEDGNESGLRGFPWVLGVSRKAFVGRLSGVREPVERGWGTAAAVAACVAGGADVVRVHDVKEMREVVRVAEGVWRGVAGR